MNIQREREREREMRERRERERERESGEQLAVTQRHNEARQQTAT